jgi:predicted nucleic acid-binding protein
MMKVTVKDANILIDLIESELLGLWFKLGVETYISDLVQLEISEESQKKILKSFIDAGLLMVEPLTPDELAAARIKRDKHRISIEDASALILAQKKKAMLLSGDGTLRKTAKAEGIDVHGVIWVLDRLVEKALLTPADAIIKLQALQALGTFLPQAICDKQIHEWRKRI